MINLITSTLTAFWISAIALLAVQNATPVSLRFFNLQTVRIPVGVLLSFSASAGMLGTSLLLARPPQPNSRNPSEPEE